MPNPVVHFEIQVTDPDVTQAGPQVREHRRRAIRRHQAVSARRDRPTQQSPSSCPIPESALCRTVSSKARPPFPAIRPLTSYLIRRLMR
jgi:hypothetical protein